MLLCSTKPLRYLSAILRVDSMAFLGGLDGVVRLAQRPQVLIGMIVIRNAVIHFEITGCTTANPRSILNDIIPGTAIPISLEYPLAAYGPILRQPLTPG